MKVEDDLCHQSTQHSILEILEMHDNPNAIHSLRTDQSSHLNILQVLFPGAQRIAENSPT